MRRHRCISAERFQTTLSESRTERIPALHQLPPDIELCLLIQHLARKRKTLTKPTVMLRIVHACDRLRDWSPDPESKDVPHDLLLNLRDVAVRLPRAILISTTSLEVSHQYLVRRLTHANGNRGLEVPQSRPRRSLLTELRKLVLRHRPAIAVTERESLRSLLQSLKSISTQERLLRRSFIVVRCCID
jgi:hypothetical protein